MIIETDRLYLREFTENDYHDLCEILQDKDVMYAYEHPFTEKEVETWYNKLIVGHYEKYGFGLWAVIHKDTNDFLGQCGLTIQKINEEEYLEIGYLFKKKHWHKGYATEAAIACRDYAFDQLKVEEVFSIIRDNNFASQNVAKQIGMTIKGIFIKFYSGIDMPHYLFSVTAVALEKRIGR